MTERFQAPKPLRHRIRGERKNVNRDFPAPNFHITEWQQGLLKHLGYIDARDFRALWWLCSNVNHHGTSELTYSDMRARLGITTKAVKFLRREFKQTGWVTKEFPVYAKLNNGIQAYWPMYRPKMNPCILHGELPKGKVPRRRRVRLWRLRPFALRLFSPMWLRLSNQHWWERDIREAKEKKARR